MEKEILTSDIMEKEILSFGDMKKKIGEHLKTTLNIEDFSITFAKLDKDGNKYVWKVNIEFKEKIEELELSRSALFTIDAITGEIMQFMNGYAWSFK